MPVDASRASGVEHRERVAFNPHLRTVAGLRRTEAAAISRWALLAVLTLTPGAAHAAPTNAPVPESFAVRPFDGAAAMASMGWGAFAIDRGKSLDLAAHNLDWADDNAAAADDVAVGVGWRSDDASALIGYEHRDSGPKPDPRRAALRDPVPWHDPAVVGLTLSIRR